MGGALESGSSRVPKVRGGLVQDGCKVQGRRFRGGLVPASGGSGRLREVLEGWSGALVERFKEVPGGRPEVLGWSGAGE